MRTFFCGEIDGDHAAGAEAAGLHDLAREVENEAGLGSPT